MKTFLTLIAAAATLVAAAPSAKADCGPRRFVGYDTCGNCVYSVACFAGYDCYGNPVYRWHNETIVRPRCEPTYSYSGYVGYAGPACRTYVAPCPPRPYCGGGISVRVPSISLSFGRHCR